MEIEINQDKQYIFDRAYINMAEEMSYMSTCVSHQVGCVITQDNRVVSTGYNGSPSKYYNCCDIFDSQNFDREEHSRWSSKVEIHAEMNAILFAARKGIEVDGGTIYCTHTPCENCLKNLIQCNIVRIIYKYDYDKSNIDSEILDLIEQKQIKFKKFEI